MEQWTNEEARNTAAFAQVESSTVALHQPKTSLVFNTRIRPCDLATIVAFFKQQGQQVTGPSQVIRLACETLVALVCEQYPQLQFSTEQAARLLEQEGMISHSRVKNAKRLARALSAEDLLETPILSRSPDPQANMASKDDVAEAMRILQQKQRPVAEVDASLINENNLAAPVEMENSPPLVAPKERLFTVLRKDGTTFEVKQDKSKHGRFQAMIICTVCNRKPQTVLFDYEHEEGTIFPSDTCPLCEGITSHLVVTQNMKRNGFEPVETAPTAVPVDEMRRILTEETPTVANEEGGEEE